MTEQNATKVMNELSKTEQFIEGSISLEMTTCSHVNNGSKVIVYMNNPKTSFYYTKLAAMYDGSIMYDSVTTFRYNEEKKRIELQIF